ncbi:MAG: hypothetical protein AAGB12_13810 [Pseudomonadota bacterium]
MFLVSPEFANTYKLSASQVEKTVAVDIVLNHLNKNPNEKIEVGFWGNTLEVSLNTNFMRSSNELMCWRLDGDSKEKIDTGLYEYRPGLFSLGGTTELVFSCNDQFGYQSKPVNLTVRNSIQYGAVFSFLAAIFLVGFVLIMKQRTKKLIDIEKTKAEKSELVAAISRVYLYRQEKRFLELQSTNDKINTDKLLSVAKRMAIATDKALDMIESKKSNDDEFFELEVELKKCQQIIHPKKLSTDNIASSVAVLKSLHLSNTKISFHFTDSCDFDVSYYSQVAIIKLIEVCISIMKNSDRAGVFVGDISGNQEYCRLMLSTPNKNTFVINSNSVHYKQIEYIKNSFCPNSIKAKVLYTRNNLGSSVCLMLENIAVGGPKNANLLSKLPATSLNSQNNQELNSSIYH